MIKKKYLISIFFILIAIAFLLMINETNFIYDSNREVSIIQIIGGEHYGCLKGSFNNFITVDTLENKIIVEIWFDKLCDFNNKIFLKFHVREFEENNFYLNGKEINEKNQNGVYISSKDLDDNETNTLKAIFKCKDLSSYRHFAFEDRFLDRLNIFTFVFDPQIYEVDENSFGILNNPKYSETPIEYGYNSGVKRFTFEDNLFSFWFKPKNKLRVVSLNMTYLIIIGILSAVGSSLIIEYKKGEFIKEFNKVKKHLKTKKKKK